MKLQRCTLFLFCFNIIVKIKVQIKEILLTVALLEYWILKLEQSLILRFQVKLQLTDKFRTV